MQQKLSMSILVLLASMGSVAAHADMVQSQALLGHNEGSLSSEVLGRDSDNALFKGKVTARAADSDADDNNIMHRMTSLATKTAHSFSQRGLASWYGQQFNGHKTASGERFNMNSMSAAHRTLPLNCTIRVTNRDTGKSVMVKVNDRGPFHGNRILDLSYAAAQRLGMTQSGTGNVLIERVN